MLVGRCAVRVGLREAPRGVVETEPSDWADPRDCRVEDRVLLLLAILEGTRVGSEMVK
jgi:hypothetical protein